VFDSADGMGSNEFVFFRCGMPAVVVSLLPIDSLVDSLLHSVTRFPESKLSFVSDVAHECAVGLGYHAARFVAGMRPGALR
jgi:hypothetical protein